MMNKPFFFFLLMFSLFSCQKDNELEGTSLGINPFETPLLPYVTVTRTISVNATLVLMDVMVHKDRFPDTIKYTHIGIIDPYGDTLITQKEKNIFINKRPSEPSVYFVGLYQEVPERFENLSRFVVP